MTTYIIHLYSIEYTRLYANVHTPCETSPARYIGLPSTTKHHPYKQLRELM